MRVLVTGGAGYIGSIIVEQLIEAGHQTLVLDNLSQGHPEAIAQGAEFIEGGVGDDAALETAFSAGPIDAVIHMAAETTIEFSMTDSNRYFQTNVADGLKLLQYVRRYQVPRVVFSSSAAVYGEPTAIPITEDAPTVPTNAYGLSKLIFEQMLAWFRRSYGLRHISLRYFNAAGASEKLGESHDPETHLIPLILRVPLGQAERIRICGTDYETRDGTCVRDYIHVSDLAAAHVLALLRMDELGAATFNLGNGEGFTVREVIDAARRMTGHPILTEEVDRRPGDPATLVASAQEAQRRLGWQPQRSSLDEIIASAWAWHRSHPHGYRTRAGAAAR